MNDTETIKVIHGYPNAATQDLSASAGYVLSKRERIYAKTVEKYHEKIELKRGTVTGKITAEDAQDLMRDAVAYALSLT